MKLNYNKKIPPFKFDRESKQNIPADVNVSVAIRLFKIWCEELKFKILFVFSRDILSIEEINHVFTMKFVMLMEWYDYRINFFNLKGKSLF